MKSRVCVCLIALFSLTLSGCPANTSNAEPASQDMSAQTAQSTVPPEVKALDNPPMSPNGTYPGWVLTSSIDTGFGVPVIALDSDNNIYMTGWYQPPVQSQSESGYAGTGAYLGKLDPDGNLLWTLVWLGKVAEDGMVISRVAIGRSNKIYVAGTYRGTIDFDPTPGSNPRNSAYDGEFFISCLSPDGEYFWTRCWGGGLAEVEQVSGMTIDNQGSLYLAGDFWGNVDFDPGPSEDRHQAPTSGGYLLKLDESGQFIWARTWAGANGNARTDALAVNDGKICVTGTLRGTVDLDPSDGILEVSSEPNDRIYLSEFSADGSFQWTRTWGGEEMNHPVDIVFDSRGDIFMLGHISSPTDFDPGPGIDTHGLQGAIQPFLVKYDSAGAYQWAKLWGGTDLCVANEFALEPTGRLLVVGRFSGSADFDPDPSKELSASTEEADIYLSEFDPDGTLLSATTFGGAGHQDAEVISLDSFGNVLLTGNFVDSLDLRPLLNCIVHDSTSMAGFICRLAFP